MTEKTESHSNGYVRLTTLAGVGIPTLGVFAAAIAVYVNMSIAPVQENIRGIREDINQIRIDLVPRKEHDRDWQAETEHFADLQRQIDENKATISQMFNAHDALTDMSARLRALEELKSTSRSDQAGGH